MNNFPEDHARKMARIASDRHLDLNKLLREHFTAPVSRKKKGKRSMKNQRKKK